MSENAIKDATMAWVEG